MLRSASGDPWTSPRVVAGHASCTGHTTKFAQQRALFYSPAKKFAQRNPFTGTFAKKLAQHATNRRFWAIFRALGELFRAFAHHQAKQGELYPARRATSGTKLSQHAPKRRFRPILRQQGELCTVSATNTTSRANFIPHAEPLPVQNWSSPVEWCNRFVSFGVGYALSWSGGSSCWVGWGVSRDLVRTSRLR